MAATTTKSVFVTDSPLIPNIALLRQQPNRQSNLSDDEPLYDAVASDDDYAALVPAPQQVTFPRTLGFKNNSIG